MSSVALLRPKSWTGAMVDSVSTAANDYIGTGGTNNRYFIKARRIMSNFRSPLNDLTGDGDVSPVPENTSFLYGEGVIDGWMIAGQDVGIINLITDSAHGSGSFNPLFNVQVNYAKDSGSGANPRNFSYDALMRRITVSWRRRSAFNGVRFQYLKNGALTEGAAVAKDTVTTHTLAKPASHTTAVLTGGAISTTGDKLYIKVHQAVFDFSTTLQEVTGDGDTDPLYEASLWLDGSVRFNGWVPAGQNIGIGNMINSDGTNPVRAVTFALASGDTIAMSGVLENVRTGLEKRQGFVSISANLVKSTTDGTETLVEA